MLGWIYKTTAVPSHGIALQNNHPECQVGFEGICGHVLVYGLHLYIFGVVLANFEKG